MDHFGGHVGQLFGNQFLFVTSAADGAFCCYLASRPDRRSLLLTAAATAVLTTLGGLSAGVLQALSVLFLYAAAAAFLQLYVHSMISPGFRRRHLPTVLTIIAPPVTALSFAICGGFIGMLLPPWTLDRNLYFFDGSLGFQPGFVMAQWLEQHP